MPKQEPKQKSNKFFSLEPAFKHQKKANHKGSEKIDLGVVKHTKFNIAHGERDVAGNVIKKITSELKRCKKVDNLCDLEKEEIDEAKINGTLSQLTLK